MLLELVKLVFFSSLIVFISKYFLAETIRKIANIINLKSRIAGDIAGYATSVPELLTITTSSIRGLNGVSVFNILSSNIINLIQYLITIFTNKNISKLKNVAIITDVIMAILTIIIPVVLLELNIIIDASIIPLYLFIYIGFRLLNNRTHKIYIREINEENDENKKLETNKYLWKYILTLLLTGILLFVISEILGNTLEKLCIFLGVSETIIGIFLGITTSIPELITFFESQRYYKKEFNEMLGVVEATNNLLTSNSVNLFVIQTIGILITKL